MHEKEKKSHSRQKEAAAAGIDGGHRQLLKQTPATMYIMKGANEKLPRDDPGWTRPLFECDRRNT